MFKFVCSNEIKARAEWIKTEAKDEKEDEKTWENKNIGAVWMSWKLTRKKPQ